MKKINKIAMMFLLTLVVAFSSFNILALDTNVEEDIYTEEKIDEEEIEEEELKVEELEGSGPLDIRDRLNKPDLNILVDGNIIFKDNNGNPVESATINSVVHINFDWMLHDEDSIRIEAQDYFDFQLPDAFKVAQRLEGSLGDYGTFIINPDGNVRFTFSELVSESSNVRGYLEFSARLNEEIVTQPGKIEIELPISEKSTIDFIVQPIHEEAAIEKSGWVDKEMNTETITWEVFINKSYDRLNNVVITDILPEGLILASVDVFPVRLNHDGTVKERDEKLSQDRYEVNGAELKFNFEINEPYVIQYTTKIDDSIKPEDGGYLYFENEAVLNSDEHKSLRASAAINAEYGKMLEKLKPVYDAKEQSLTWTVQYNYGEKNIFNPLLEDTFDSELEYVDGSLRITNKNNEEVAYDFDFKNDPKNHLSLQFKEPVSEPINITYKTIVKDGVLVIEDKKYSNVIKTEGKESSNTGEVKENMVIKTSPDIDYKDKKIQWQIDVNVNEYDLMNYSLTDTYTYRGLTLDESTFKVFDAKLGTLVDQSNYTVVKTTDEFGETGFKVFFINEYEQTSSHLIITFDTDYDINSLSSDSQSRFVNHVTLNWQDKDGRQHEHDSEATREVNDKTRNHGLKFGTYNAKNKEITWNIKVNYNSDRFMNASLSDKILDGQKFIDQSLSVKKYEVNKDGTTVVNENVEPLENFEIDYPREDNDYTLHIKLPEGDNTKYEIEFKTKVTDDLIHKEYNNTANYKNNNKDYPLIASVTVKNAQKYINKKGVQNESLIHWSIAINESQSIIKNAEIHDFPSNNQLLLVDSIKIYPVIVSDDESYTVNYEQPLKLNDDFTVQLLQGDAGAQPFIIKFNDTLDRTYRLEYDTQINTSKDNLEVSNEASLEGSELKYEDRHGETTIVIDVNSAGGGAVGERGSFVIKKVNEHSEPLEGVQFELYNPLGRKVATRSTSTDGTIDFQGLVYGEYTLKEVKTLEGYVIDKDLIEGIKIQIDENSSKEENVLVFVNKKNKLSINKKDLEGTLLEGAVFRLEVLVENDYVTAIETVRVVDGVLEVFGLKPGSYRLLETHAPQGYIMNTEALMFTIDEDEYGQSLDKSVEMINYKGSVKLIKHGEENTLLEGVLFDLYTDEDELVFSDLKTDSNGELNIYNNLSPGNYYFKETQSALGHITNETPLAFNIPSEYEGIPEPIELHATNHKGTVQFMKTNKEHEPLSNVEFELYSFEQEKEYGKFFSNDQGIVHVDHLEPGRYEFREIKAKEGYILNTEPLIFEISTHSSNEKEFVHLGNFINYQGSLSLEKVNEDGDLLDGSLFYLYDAAGKKVTNIEPENGKASVENLPVGKYTIVEHRAPEGYRLTEKEYEVIIPERHSGKYDGERVSIVNEREQPVKPSSPSTGLSRTSVYLLMLNIGSIITLFRLKKGRRIKNK